MKKKKIADIRYAYYEAPHKHISYKDFLISMDIELDESNMMFFEEYTQVISEAELKNTVTNIRYDFSIAQRKEIIHPVSHLHIGSQNSIRIPISFIMTPKNFVAFVVRHIYWDKWRIIMEDDTFRENYLASYSSGIQLDSILFTQNEKKDLYLNFNQ
nr:DUF2290 domain-containing protein [Bacillus subtilis]